MIRILSRLLNISISAGILILAVLLIRILFRRIPKRLFIAAWILVMLRLACPFTIPNAYSPIPADFFSGKTGEIGMFQPGSPFLSEEVFSEKKDDAEFFSALSESSENRIAEGLEVLWISGCAILLTRAGIKTVKHKKTVRNAILQEDNFYLCSGIQSPFILGLIRPRIYIPVSADAQSRRFIIDHEKTHIRYLDHLLKFLFYLLVTVHWFNPLCHIAYGAFCEDLEMACDESLVCCDDAGYTAGYMQALLDCGAASSAFGREVLSFGSISIKRRVKRMMNYQKTKRSSAVIFILVCIALAFFFMTSRASAAEDYSRSVVIRDAEENIVENLVQEEKGQLEAPVKASPKNEPVINSERSEQLVGIRDAALREGYYRSTAEEGTPYCAVCEGKVLRAEYESRYGYCVTVLDSEGRTWKYGHCSEIAVKEGETVSFGNLLAYTGATGFTEEPAIIISVSK